MDLRKMWSSRLPDQLAFDKVDADCRASGVV